MTMSNMDARSECRAWARTMLARSDAVILDTETTGLDGFCVQIAVINLAGDVLLDTLVNPLDEISPEAYAVHGLDEFTLASAPTFAQVEPQLRALLHGKQVLVYNVAFDQGILRNEFARNEIERLRHLPIDHPSIAEQGRQVARDWFRACDWHCAMEWYAQWVGEWSKRHGGYRWQPLPDGDHTALGDCRATLTVLKWMAGEDEDSA